MIRLRQVLRLGDSIRFGQVTIQATNIAERKVYLVFNAPGHVLVGWWRPGQADTFERLRVKVTSVQPDRCMLRIQHPDDLVVKELNPNEERSSHVNGRAGPLRSAGRDSSGDAGDLEDLRGRQ